MAGRGCGPSTAPTTMVHSCSIPTGTTWRRCVRVRFGEGGDEREGPHPPPDLPLEGGGIFSRPRFLWLARYCEPLFLGYVGKREARPRHASCLARAAPMLTF